jgi:hypothetical protein
MLKYFILTMVGFGSLYPSNSEAQRAASKPDSTGSYSAKPFDGKVPSHFMGNDVRQIVLSLEAHGISGKGEFETSAEYQRRLNSLEDLPIAGTLTRKSTIGIVIPSARDNHLDYTYNSDLIISYDADKEQMHVNLISGKTMKPGETDDPRSLAIIWGGNEPTFRTYMGSNSFGVKIKVSEERSLVYGIAFDVPDGTWRGESDLSGTGKGINFSFKLPVERAKVMKSRLRALVICRIKDGEVMEGFEHLKPTLEAPNDVFTTYKYLHIQPSEVWIFDYETGEVFTKSINSFPVSNLQQITSAMPQD